MDQQRLRAQLYPHLPRTTAVGSTSLTLPTAVELSSRLEDAECASHRPLEPRIGPRLYMITSLRLHQLRLIPSTWRGGTTS
eukprot:12867591-Heterocapsa_arctica.AAC.1